MVSLRMLYVLIAYIYIPWILAESWPYHRVYTKAGLEPNKSATVTPPRDLFLPWLRNVLAKDESVQLRNIFKNGTIPDDILTIDGLFMHLHVPDPSLDIPVGPPTLTRALSFADHDEAQRVFGHLSFPIDPRCTISNSSWWYRTYDGSCNWLKQGESDEGTVGTKRKRDYNQYSFSDGFSKPREGPNARAVSNAFFKRKRTLYYEHTPLLLGLIEFIMHDITYSIDSKTEFVDVPVPEDETLFSENTTFRVWRTAPVPGTGTSRGNPRKNINMATSWLDVSSLYGSTAEVAHLLRSHKKGKLLTQEVQARGTRALASYLPYNLMNVPTNTRPDVDPAELFAGGDPRTNEDWMMLAVHTLMLREHNRLCDIVATRKPDWDDEQIYQAVRLLMSAKYALIANSYQMAYWTDEMPWPRDDGFPLYRQMFGEGPLEIGPANTYPWPLVTKNGKPMTASAEMAIVYRFHEFIISDFPIKDAANETLWEQDLFSTGFNATGFVDVGLENILRGMVATHIPNFKSGVNENFRSAGTYRGHPFDIVTWSIIHEREQGLPTFNEYFRAYNLLDPEVEVPIRDTWEKFSSDPEMVTNLKKLYRNPDEVNLVGVQLDEEYFPGTTVPKSSLIISLFSLFGLGNSDRFSIGFAMMRCWLVDTPFNCHPSNALEDLIWKPMGVPGLPNFRFYDPFWLKELDLQAHGVNLLWRLITENSEIKCVPKAPLFPQDAVKTPVLCALPETPSTLKDILLQIIQITLAFLRQHYLKVIVVVLAGIIAVYIYIKHWEMRDTPPVLTGWPVIGEALLFQKNPLVLLKRGLDLCGDTASRCFGIKLASYVHYILTNREDLEMIAEDNPYEIRFNLHNFLDSINFSIITKKENFDSDLHTKLIRTHLGDPKTVSEFGGVIKLASREFLRRKPLASEGTGQKHESLNDWINEYITFVISRCIVGPVGYDNSQLIQTFMVFNDHAVNAMGLSSMLPKFLQSIAAFGINKDFKTIHDVTLPIISERRNQGRATDDGPVFLDFILEVVDDDKRAADLIAVIVWGGLVNLQSTFSSTLLDIINDEKGQESIFPTLASTTADNLDTFHPGSFSPWNSLQSAMFESIRLCGPCTGPARMVEVDIHLRSQPSLRLPQGSVASLSAYTTHRDTVAWGTEAALYQPGRFTKSPPPIGEPEFISWGLKGPHICPGRWFAQAAIQIMTRTVLEAYVFEPEKRLADEDKYVYSAGNVGRVPVAVMVTTRKRSGLS